VKLMMLTFAGGVAALLALAPAAQAAPWQSINQREYRLTNRINQGVRNGALNRSEAARLRYRYRQLTGLENRYRRSGGGLSMWERRDLDRRFDSLSRSIRVQRHDRQRRWRR
jgi:hypothetical protein